MSSATKSRETLAEPSPANAEPLSSSRNAHPAPDNLLVVIEPGRAWAALNLRDLWTYRELLYFLTWRDVKVRYKQTLLGATWAVLQPLLTMLIFTLLFGKLGAMPSDNIPYPLFAYAGLLPWTFFANTVNNSGNSLVNSAHLVTKVYFPRLLIPTAAVGAGLVDFVVSFALLVPLMLYYRVPLASSMLMLAPLVALTTVLAIAAGTWIAALNVKYRDIRHALPFLIQIWMYASCIIFPLSSVPQKWRWVFLFNPVVGIIEGFRSALFGKPFGWTLLGASVLATVLILLYSLHTFRRMEKSFADLI